MWKLNLEDDYFRIYDSNKQIAGYFDPDYGKTFPKENESEIIFQMLKNHEKISGGYLMVPMIKFRIFDSDYEGNVISLENQISSVLARISSWKKFLAETSNQNHVIRISHTDQDMLSITILLRFSSPVSLKKQEILKAIEPTLDLMQKQGLL